MQYKPYVPQDVGELLDYLGYMMLASPTFKDKTGYFPRQNIDTAFLGLNEGLLVARKVLEQIPLILKRIHREQNSLRTLWQ